MTSVRACNSCCIVIRYQYRMPAGGELELTKQLNGRVRTFDAYLGIDAER